MPPWREKPARRMMTPLMLEGFTVCAGVAIGPVRLRGYELDRPMPTRLPATRIEEEVRRFRAAVSRSVDQVGQLRAKLSEGLGAAENRILEVHLSYLRDPTFLEDVENRIRSGQLALEDALARAVRDFDRIFELVESEHMKERALDLRDVALRVIRNLERRDDEAAVAPDAPYVLATHKLSLTDLFDIDHEHVLGIIAEHGGPDSHAGILARSLGIPTVTGIGELRETFRDGDFVIVDAGTGVVHVDPDERLRREYEVRVSVPRIEAPFEDLGPISLADGVEITVLGACGNLGEVTQCRDAGLDGIGVYRTELLYLVDRHDPGEELLMHHYQQVAERAGEGARTAFRLLDLTHAQKHAIDEEPNPALGARGIRGLLAEPDTLRLQLRALLRAQSVDTPLDILVPFVSTAQDIQRVQECVRGERAQLMKLGIACAPSVRIGAIIEVPAAAFYVDSIAAEADFLVVALDALQQYLLAADRDNLAVGDWYRGFHPALFHLLKKLAEDAAREETKIMLFGESATDPLRLPFHLGVGYRAFAVSPVRSPGLRQALRQWTLQEASEVAQRVLECRTSLDVQRCLLEAER